MSATHSNGSELPDVSEKAFAEMERRLTGLEPLLPGETKQSVYASLPTDREQFWETLLSDLMDNSELRAALRVALAAEEDQNHE